MRRPHCKRGLTGSVMMIRSHDHCLENLRRKSQRLAQELQDLKSLRDQVRSLEARDQRERRQDLACRSGRISRVLADGPKEGGRGSDETSARTNAAAYRMRRL